MYIMRSIVNEASHSLSLYAKLRKSQNYNPHIIIIIIMNTTTHLHVNSRDVR